MDDGVELVAVDDEEVAAVGGLVDGAVGNDDAAEMGALERTQELVVVAGDVDDAGALAALAQQLLDDVVVALRPVPGAAQPPAVDDVADEDRWSRRRGAQEIEQEFGLRRLRAEMDVGEEQGAECGVASFAMPSALLGSLCADLCNRRMTVAAGRSLRSSSGLLVTSGGELMDLGIGGKKAIVCASSRGLGRGCATALAEAGCDLVVNGRDARRSPHRRRDSRPLRRRRHRGPGRCLEPESRPRCFAACPEPDILVNNNGGPPRRDFTSLPARILGWRHHNMVTPLELIQAMIDGMAERGFGRIVNITSLSVYVPIPGLDSRPARGQA